jgi:hypothetical protein
MDQEFFHKGYVAGWQSIKGHDGPVVVPTSPVQVGRATYMLASRGVLETRSQSPPIDEKSVPRKLVNVCVTQPTDIMVRYGRSLTWRRVWNAPREELQRLRSGDGPALEDGP